jgi:soluble cytochrome b562
MTGKKFSRSDHFHSWVILSPPNRHWFRSISSLSIFPLEDSPISIRIWLSMKSKFFIAACVVSNLLMIPASADDSELAKQMEVMNDAYKAMRREEDPAKGAALAREAQDAMVKAIKETPELIKAMPEGPDKSKASAEYRKMMGTLVSTLADMELAFLNKDMEKVKAIVEQMRDAKKKGHDKFMEEE